MAGQIRMTPETMRSRAGEVRTQGSDFEVVINKMQNIINDLQAEWEGAASAGFASQFDRLKPSFNEMRQLIDDIGGQLDATATAVENLDNEIASKFSS
jgi:WXG100 family type VII secretion target